MDSTRVIKEIRSGSMTNVIDTRLKPGYLKWRSTARLPSMHVDLSSLARWPTTPGATQVDTYNTGLSKIASAECLLGWK
jgi:hypothetical protein